MQTRLVKIGDIPLIEADNGLGLKVRFSSYGATIYSIVFDGKIMTLTPKEVKDFARKDNFYGKTVGPIAGRVKEGLVEINGVTYQMDKNEGENTLHGGDFSVNKFLFTGKVTNNNDVAFSIRYTFTKKKMKDGLPGNVKYMISYYLSATENLLLCDYKVIPDDDTVIALTNHSYFCLGDKNIDNLYLTNPASKFVHPNVDDLLPEELREVTPVMDFRTRKRIKLGIDDPYLKNSKTNGYDHYYLKDDIKAPIILENSSYKLEITSTFEGAQIYTDNYPDNVAVYNTKEDTFNRAVAIEPMDNPLDRKITGKKDMYQREIIYRFFKK